ncbi:MAG: MFS transporter [Acidimicrobiales bacterium]
MTHLVKRVSTETFRSLHIRNFRLFFTGQLISQIGTWLTFVTQTLLVFKLTGSGVALGLLAAFQFGPVLLIGPWAGLIADRSDERRLLFVVQCGAMLKSFVLAALAFSGNPPVAAVFAVALAGGVALAFDNPARRAFVVEMVPTEDVNNAVSLNSALMTGSRVVGPGLARQLGHTRGVGWAFLGDGLSYLAVLAGLWLMNPAELRPSTPTPRAKGQVRAGLRYVRRVPDLWVPLVMMAVIGTLAFNFQVIFPLFATRDLDGTDTTFTLLFSVISLGSLVGALATARRTSITISQVALAAVAFGLALVLMAVAPTQAFAFPVGVLVGGASIAFMTASTSIVQMRSDPTMRGRVLALQAMVFLGSTPIGGPLLGWICQQFGARYGIALGAVGAIGAGLWGLASVRRSDAAGRTQTEALPDGVDTGEVALVD